MRTAPPVDRNGLTVLPRDKCLQLLRSVTMGRVAVTDRALPVILPVNFAMLDDDIVFRTEAGTKLAAATRHAVVAFEADAINHGRATAWSVSVTGMASEITDPDELERARALPLFSLVGIRHRYVRIGTELISGRRLG